MPTVGPTVRGAQTPAPLPIPTGFSWSIPFDIYDEVTPGNFGVSFKESSLLVSTTDTRYVDVATGNDANAGTNPLLPKKSIWSAINLGLNSTIYVKQGVYTYDYSWRLPQISNCNVIGVTDFTTLAPGQVVSSCAYTPLSGLGAWSETVGYEGSVWEASLAAAPYAVVDDTMQDGFIWVGKLYTEEVSVVNVEGNPGTWFWDAGKLYVHPWDARTPDTDIRALRKSSVNGHSSVAVNWCIKNITFEGGNARCFFAQNVGTISFIDCVFRYGQSEGFGLQTTVAGATHTVYHIRSSSFGHLLGDGCQYTVSGAGTNVHAVEIDCDFSQSCATVGTTYQGSTAHFTVGNGHICVIRIGGTYTDNMATYNIADVGGVADAGGCQTWMLGVTADGTIGFSGDGGFYCGGATGKAWLHRCTLGPSTNYDIETSNAGTAVKRFCTPGTTSGPGTVGFYDPWNP